MPLKTTLAKSFSEDIYIDIHCHVNKRHADLAIQSFDTHEIIDAGDYFSIGIHPWYIERQDMASALHKMKQLAENSEFLLALGECGLDKAIALDFELQTQVFKMQIQLAEKYKKPLIIHCVKAYNELMQLKKTLRPAMPWIIHGFNGNTVLAEQLIKQGCYLSIGKNLLQNNQKWRGFLKQVPLDKLFLETDTAQISITHIYTEAAKGLNISVSTLKQQIQYNFNNLFI